MARLHTRRLQRQDQWQQYTADLCAPAATASQGPQPSISAPAGVCKAPELLNQPITSAEIESALPLIHNNRPGAAQGWLAELFRYVYRVVHGEDGKVLKFHVLARPLAASLVLYSSKVSLQMR